MIKLLKLTCSIFICLVAGAIGSLLTTPAIATWYATLKKPFFNPPNWIFAPVWTLLFILMGIALYLVWEEKNGAGKGRAVTFFFLQLLLNICWSLFFFYLKAPLLAFVEVIVFWIMILLTIMEFNKISKTAAMILFPYLLWVSFASFLNLSIVLLN